MREEHTYSVVGYDGEGVWANDPWDGARKHYAWDTFLHSWALLGYMAVSAQPPSR